MQFSKHITKPYLSENHGKKLTSKKKKNDFLLTQVFLHVQFALQVLQLEKKTTKNLNIPCSK